MVHFANQTGAPGHKPAPLNYAASKKGYETVASDLPDPQRVLWFQLYIVVYLYIPLKFYSLITSARVQNSDCQNSDRHNSDFKIATLLKQ